MSALPKVNRIQQPINQSRGESQIRGWLGSNIHSIHARDEKPKLKYDDQLFPTYLLPTYSIK